MSAAAQRVEQAIEALLADDTLPIPPADRTFVGDGPFVEIGAEFLRWFVELGGLKPDERVLDLGCGIGRMALPLTRYLDGGRYVGLDVVADGIEWCRANIGARHPAFRFAHLDLHHPIYNPIGRGRTSEVRLPLPDACVDFAFMTSVLTHLPSTEVAAYAREVRRVLAPGGRLLVTAFLLNPPSRAALAAGRAALAFPVDAATREVELHADHPGAAVAFDEDFLLATFLGAGLRRRRPAVYGRWSGRDHAGNSFQDICVLDIDGDMPRSTPR
jgi:SAM-dependent methyltransferase